MVFVFYQFNESPLNFNPTAIEDVRNSEFAAEFHQLEIDKKEIELAIKDKQLLYFNIENIIDKKNISNEITSSKYSREWFERANKRIDLKSKSSC